MKWSNLNRLGKAAVILGILLLVAIIAGAVGFVAGIGVLPPLRIIFGLIYTLFLPGYILTFIFFPRGEKSIDFLERIALSFALSIAVVPLVIFYLNLIGLKISAINSFLSILGILIIESVVLILARKKRRTFH